MELTEDRSDEIAESLEKLIDAMNSISEDEIKAIMYTGEHEEAITLFTDPTRYIKDANSIRGTQTFLKSLLHFKQSVKGIGYCK